MAACATVLLTALMQAACGGKEPPVVRPGPPPPPDTTFDAGARPPSPPVPPSAPSSVPSEPFANDSINSSSLDEINRNSPLGPVFFGYDSSEIDSGAQRILDANADVLRRNPRWTITIEGHCDERGPAEYNLALGERRAAAARSYLISLGVAADRLRTVSYGKEFPFDPGHDESAWAKNRRAHFVVTAQ